MLWTDLYCSDTLVSDLFINSGTSVNLPYSKNYICSYVSLKIIS